MRAAGKPAGRARGVTRAAIRTLEPGLGAPGAAGDASAPPLPRMDLARNANSELDWKKQLQTNPRTSLARVQFRVSRKRGCFRKR